MDWLWNQLGKLWEQTKQIWASLTETFGAEESWDDWRAGEILCLFMVGFLSLALAWELSSWTLAVGTLAAIWGIALLDYHAFTEYQPRSHNV